MELNAIFTLLENKPKMLLNHLSNSTINSKNYKRIHKVRFPFLFLKPGFEKETGSSLLVPIQATLPRPLLCHPRTLRPPGKRRIQAAELLLLERLLHAWGRVRSARQKYREVHPVRRVHFDFSLQGTGDLEIHEEHSNQDQGEGGQLRRRNGPRVR